MAKPCSCSRGDLAQFCECQEFKSRTENGPVQFCRGALERGEPSHRITTYTTLHLDGDTRRFHFCDRHPVTEAR